MLLGDLPVSANTTSSGGVSAGPLHWDPTNPATRNYYIPSIAPGGTYSDQIRVQNPNSGTVDLYVNAVDGITAIPSGAVYANRTDPVRKWGAWVTPAVTTISLRAGQSALVAFAVHVPADAQPGDHLAGVAFENAHPTAGSGALNITSIVRTVVGILIEVPGPAAFQLTIGRSSIQAIGTPARATVIIPLTDSGLLLGRPRLTVTLDGPRHYHRSVTRQLDTILPGDTIAFPFPWPDSLASGVYTIAVGATAPGMAPVSVTSTFGLGVPLVGVPAPAPTPHSAPSSSTRSALAPWVLPAIIGANLLLVGLLGAIAFLILLLRRRRHGADEAVTSSSTRAQR